MLVWGKNALYKIPTKQLGGGGVLQNALFKIAAKQCLRLLITLDFDA